MKCSDKNCPTKAEFAKVGEESAWCDRHAPVHIPALHELDELPCNSWDHVDGLSRCCSCDIWHDEGDTETCDGCQERACADCIGDNGECRACNETAEYRDDVRSTAR